MLSGAHAPRTAAMTAPVAVIVSMTTTKNRPALRWSGAPLAAESATNPERSPRLPARTWTSNVKRMHEVSARRAVAGSGMRSTAAWGDEPRPRLTSGGPADRGRPLHLPEEVEEAAAHREHFHPTLEMDVRRLVVAARDMADGA